MNIIILYFFFLIFSLFLLHIRLLKDENVFVNAILLSLNIVSSFALFVTNFKSIYLLSLSATFLFIVFSGRFQLKIEQSDWFKNLIVVSSVFIIFLLLFWRNGNIFILHSDYLFWIRLIDANLNYGVENTGTFYNAVSDNYPSNELYHYFEFWLTSVGKLINRQSTAMNLFLFAYPVGAVLLMVGLKELIQTFFNFKKEYQTTVASFFVLVVLLFFTHPWDLITESIKIKKLPISSMSPWWLGFKTCFVTLAALPLFLYWRTKKIKWLYFLSVSVFLYPPVLPILILTACLSWLLEWVRQNNPEIKALVSLIASGLFFVTFYKVTGNGGSTVSGFAPMEWLILSNWFRFIPAILMKSLFIPLVALSPVVLYLYYLWRKKALQKSVFINLLLLYIVCIGVWMAFIKNIDANQSFLLLFTPVICLSIAFLLIHLWFKKQFITAILIVFIYIAPELAGAFNHKSPLLKAGDNTTPFLKKIGGASILYIPDKYENNNVYQFNERVYTGIDHFIMVNPNLKLYSAAAASIIDTVAFNPITLSMYHAYRSMSPFYKSCGFVQPESNCMREWAIKLKINYICTRPGKSVSTYLAPVSVDSDFVIYEVK